MEEANNAKNMAMDGLQKINQNTAKLREHFVKFIKANSIIVFIVIGILFLSIISYRLTPKPRILLVNRIINNHIENQFNLKSVYQLYGESSYQIQTDGYIKADSLFKKKDINNNSKDKKKDINNKYLYFTLCDFYIASSAKTYLLMNKYYDYCSLDSIRNILYTGARFIELDIFRKGLNEYENYPVVTNGIEKGEWKLCLNDLCLKSCLEIIKNIGLDTNKTKANNNPLILYLNFNINSELDSESIIKANKNQEFYKYTDKNADYIFYNKVAKIIESVFSSDNSNSNNNHLLGQKYNIHNEDINSTNHSPIQLENIYNFKNKLIIMSNISGSCSNLAQYINLVCPKEPKLNGHLYSLRSYNYKEFKGIYDINKVRSDNQNLLTHIYDGSDKNSLENYMPGPGFREGSQLISMYYQKDDSNMEAYLNTNWSVNAVYTNNDSKQKETIVNHSFKYGGLILKPEYLRLSYKELIKNTKIK